MNRQDDSARQARVLILDDDEDVAVAMQDVLEPPHDVRVVHNLDTAWAELTARAPDVFIVDLYIGTRRSDQLISTVHEKMPQVRCVLVSGSDRAAWAHLLERGMVQFALRKPVLLKDLIALVDGQVGGAKR